MNAEAHLRAQGWAGPGTGLRAGSLQRAILTSKKTDLKGLGAKQNESDQWWDNIFSKQLSNITVGPQGVIGQVNGGISAAHPVAARHAHKKQFGEKSALQKVFVMGEVLKGNESFIPLARVVEEKKFVNEKGTKKRQRSSEVMANAAIALPSPPPSPTSVPECSEQAELVQILSDKAIRRESRRIRKETKELDKAAKAARKEKRRLKKLNKLKNAG